MSEACLADAESYHANPDLGTLLHWADCLEDSGQIASAYLAFEDAVTLASRVGDARAENAERHRAALKPRLSYVTISVPAERRLPSLAIERDGFGIGSASWGLPVATDPGHHRIHVSAPGYRPLDLDFDLVGDAAVASVEIPALEPEPPTAPPTAPPIAPEVVAVAVPGEAVSQTPAIQPPPAPLPEPLPQQQSTELPTAPKKQKREQAHTLATNQKDALVIAGVGVTSLAASLYFFGKTRSTLAARNGVCPAGTDCQPGTNALLQNLTDDATSNRSMGLVLLGIGMTTSALAIGLWTFTPTQPGATQRASLGVSINPSGGRVSFGGSL